MVAFKGHGKTKARETIWRSPFRGSSMLGSKLFLMWRGTARCSRRRGALLLLGWRCSEPRCHSFLKHRGFFRFSKKSLKPHSHIVVIEPSHCKSWALRAAWHHTGSGRGDTSCRAWPPVASDTKAMERKEKAAHLLVSCSQPQVVLVIWEEYLGKVAFLFTFIVFVKLLKISRNPC